jgi:hypothetical protein
MGTVAERGRRRSVTLEDVRALLSGLLRALRTLTGSVHAKRRWGTVAWLLIAASVLLPLPACSCDPSPYLGVTSRGAPAIGWRTDGTEQVRGARLVEADGTTVWEISSAGADPTVITVGAPVEGFETVTPLEGPVQLSGRTLWVFYDRAGTPVEDAYWPYVDDPYEPSTRRAVVEELECGRGWQDLDLGRPLGILVAGLIGVSLLLLLGVALGHAAVVRAASRRRPQDDA